MPHAVSARKVRSVPNTSLAILALVGILHGRQASAHRDAISESSLTVRCWAGSDNILISIRTDFKKSAATLLKTEGLILRRLVPLGAVAVAMASSLSLAQSPPPTRVKTLSPPDAIKAEGTWSLGARAGDFVFVAGMQGVDPATNALVQDPQARILRAFLNLKLIAESERASLQDCVRLTVYVSDLKRFAPMVDKVQAELWGKPPYPPRTMVEVRRLFDDDIVEIDSVFYAPANK
jgi:enamine deaminase RidA (YjgF/YER057c/UK114 family)